MIVKSLFAKVSGFFAQSFTAVIRPPGLSPFSDTVNLPLLSNFRQDTLPVKLPSNKSPIFTSFSSGLKIVSFCSGEPVLFVDEKLRLTEKSAVFSPYFSPSISVILIGPIVPIISSSLPPT